MRLTAELLCLTLMSLSRAGILRNKIKSNSRSTSTLDIDHNAPTSPEISMSSVELIVHRGYRAEMHSVTTQDGYILMLHRIPYPKGISSGVTGRPVFIQHGIIGSSADWLIPSSNTSLAFQLADLGYDVWLGNCRGNTYSRSHVSMNPSQSDVYWNFSFDEMGKFDLPAVFNYILTATGKEKLVYIGFSMGTTMFFVCMIHHPELNDKIELMVAMGPVSTLARLRSGLRFAVPFTEYIQFVLERLFRTRSYLSQAAPLVQLQKRFCEKNIRVATLCQNAVFYIAGADTTNIDLALLPAIDGHLPAGTSVKTLVHYSQNARRRLNTIPKFSQYNFGWIGNLRRYGRLQPPDYDLSKVTAPVYIFYALQDFIATPDDVAWLSSKLANVAQTVLVEDPDFNHEDFLFAVNINEQVYHRVIQLLPPP